MRTAALLLFLLAQEERKNFDPAVHEGTKIHAFADFRIIPVRVHLLQCKGQAALHCGLKEEDIRRVFGKVNRIWNKAGLAMRVESITPEDAVVAEDFNELRLEDYRATRPAPGASAGMIHVYYVTGCRPTASSWAATPSSSRTPRRCAR